MSIRLTPVGLRSMHGWGPFAEELLREMGQVIQPEEAGSSATELYKTEDGWVLRAMVPGFAKDEIDLDVSKNHISITAQAKLVSLPSHISAEGREVVSQGKLIRGGFASSVQYREQIPGTLDPSTATAALVDGILTISVRSVLKAQLPNRITIQ